MLKALTIALALTAAVGYTVGVAYLVAQVFSAPHGVTTGHTTSIDDWHDE